MLALRAPIPTHDPRASPLSPKNFWPNSAAAKPRPTRCVNSCDDKYHDWPVSRASQFRARCGGRPHQYLLLSELLEIAACATTHAPVFEGKCASPRPSLSRCRANGDYCHERNDVPRWLQGSPTASREKSIRS